MRISIINGANLNLLGKREPEIYGSRSFEQYFSELKDAFPNVELYYYQSNIEGEIVNFIQNAAKEADAIIINAGGYSHTSVVIADALKSTKLKCVEVHISNIFSREEMRHTSLVSKYVEGVIVGLGLDGYRLAILHLLN
jgi:3-dehydroquinate dehydratase-2